MIKSSGEEVTMRSNRLLFVLVLLVFSGGEVWAQSNKSGRVVQTDDSFARSHIERGNAAYARGDYEAAIGEYLGVSPELKEDYARALYNIGVCYYEMRRDDEAEQMYRRAIIARGGRYPKAQYALGVVLEDLARPEDALAAYRAAISAAHGKCPEAEFKLGVLAAKAGDLKDAEVRFRHAIAESKEFPESHNNLGVVLARAGRLRDAELEFAAALEQSGGDFAQARRNLDLCQRLLAASNITETATPALVNVSTPRQSNWR